MGKFSEMPAGWIPLFGSFATGVILTVFLFRRRWVESLYACWALGGGSSLVLYVVWATQVGDFLWIRLVSLALLLVPFFHLLNMAATARRVRICVALARHPQGLTEAKLIAALRLESMGAHRIRILQQFGQVRVAGGKVSLIRNEFLWIARCLNQIKKTMGIPEFL